MLERFDDNTKLIVVDGLPGVGKRKLAKKLAEEFEMLYVPPPNFDDMWINAYGVDLRSFNDRLPVDAQYWDLNTFLNDPRHRNVTAMQLGMLQLRCSQYIDALAHLLSTGQGVVLQRSPWADNIFALAMARAGYISKSAFEFYTDAILNILHEFMRPHLVVYLDAPISVVKQNIKRRNISAEVNSKALTDEYLGVLETQYRDYLKGMSKYGNLLIYDCGSESELDGQTVVEDIELLDFTVDDDRENDKFKDWRWTRKSNWMVPRWKYTSTKFQMLLKLNICRYDVPELMVSGQDQEILSEVMEKDNPSSKFAPGFNPGIDKNILFKTNTTYEEQLPNALTGKKT